MTDLAVYKLFWCVALIVEVIAFTWNVFQFQMWREIAEGWDHDENRF